jgi:uncharacterized protein YneF (UPF0154 family)
MAIILAALSIIAFISGFIYLCIKYAKYKAKKSPKLLYPGWAVPHDSQTPIKL